MSTLIIDLAGLSRESGIRATFGPVTWSMASETGPLGDLASLRGGLPGGWGTTMEGGARD